MGDHGIVSGYRTDTVGQAESALLSPRNDMAEACGHPTQAEALAWASMPTTATQPGQPRARLLPKTMSAATATGTPVHSPSGPTPKPPACAKSLSTNAFVPPGLEHRGPRLLAGGRLELDHQLSWHPAAVLDLDALLLGPLADFRGVRSASRSPAPTAGWPPGTPPARRAALTKGASASRSSRECSALRSISYSTPSSPNRTVPSASLPSRSSMNSVCIL